MMPTDISIERLVDEAVRLGIDGRLEGSAPALLEHFRLLYAWNRRFNLTSIRDPAVGLRRHLLESLLAVPLVTEDACRGGRLVDLGSGNGYPALPLVICLPALRATLFEASGRKVDFLRAAARKAGCLERVDVRHERIGSPSRLPEGATVVTLRAFPSPEKWVPAVARHPGIRLVLAWLSDETAGRLAGPLREEGAVVDTLALPTRRESCLLAVTPGGPR